ncbi:hypothetical protein SARC_10303 [Sphaeroforma arctica JP610]|uniref:ASCH domain-containing protein n=1 Tax=Sphaeroforma arctica JP610 TaxID=667725 RepID=A0A0L0FKD3_9EUKA|nr:hypothetical protein SARC_10303 [Sphaeroforma arctica JP610]KNC77234.1 hypothetical protein SARC_10303 [Sphaeroforma arctica JP610]|eukprot:XP_014151136.1 hypothetical protein SARC_10303 [Sphaeroforma arctica JP610]
MSLHRQSSYASTMKIEMLFKAKENGSLHAISEAEATSGDRTSVEHALHVVPEYYNLLASGKKSVEGRLNMGDEAHVCVGDILVMNGTLRLHVKRIALYGSIQEYLVTEGLDVCLPDKDTIDEGVQVYYRFYTPEQEAEFGVLAFEVTVL